MQTVVILGLGFLLAAVLAEALRRWKLAHGAPLFAALGIAAGASFTGVVDSEMLVALKPGLGVLVGWVGLLAGLSLTVRRDGDIVRGALRAGFVHAFVVIAGVGAGSWGLLTWLLPGLLAPEEVWLTAAAIAAACLSASPAAVDAIASRHAASGPVREAAVSLARVARALALLCFAVALAFHERPTFSGVRPLAPTEWLLAEVLAGVAVGLTLDTFLGPERHRRRAVLILAAASVFATGVAWKLGLSALLLNLVIGLTVANLGRREAMEHLPLPGLEHPTVALLLVALGAAWIAPTQVAAWLFVVGILAIRLACVATGGSIAGRALDPDDPGLRRVGFTLLGQGAPALAIAAAWLARASPEAGQLVLTIVGASVLIDDLWCLAAARIVLDEAGEIPTVRQEA